MLNGYGLMVNSSTGEGRGDIPSPTGEYDNDIKTRLTLIKRTCTVL
jgi:hypothetical protein